MRKVWGRLKWYDRNKGFGYITSEDGKDVKISASAAETMFMPKGMDVFFTVEDTLHGPRLKHVIGGKFRLGDHPKISRWVNGSFKFYDAESGFGFADVNGNDVYIGSRLASCVNISVLNTGDAISLRYIHGERGLKAVELRTHEPTFFKNAGRRD